MPHRSAAAGRGYRIIFTVTNDLSYDQRMIRICTSLATQGFDILLVGRVMKRSLPLVPAPFRQKRLRVPFQKGLLFYASYNIRLFLFLLFSRADAICAIDLDTILPGLIISGLKRIPRVYDAHELFCEMKEVVSRPPVYKFWKWIERRCVPRFHLGYTVNDAIAAEFKKMYGRNYATIRNLPILTPLSIPMKHERFIIYQGAVNEGRSFETLIPAMHTVNARLMVCGDGNFMQQAKSLVLQHGLQDKVIFTGYVEPAKLKTYTLGAYIGVALVDDVGLNSYYSLANRFFDYMHAGVPQICVDYPSYRHIIDQYPFAVLVSDISSDNLANELNNLLTDDQRYAELQRQCLIAREELNWQREELKLIEFYTSIFTPRG
jgi:glycosyltransferase involved in cell wall biosynthesis